MKRGTVDAELIRYLPGITDISYQGMIYVARIKKVPVDSTHKDFQTLEFNIKLPANQYMNLNSVHICLPIQIKIKTDPTDNVPAGTITENNLFAHWIKEIDIKQYGDDLQILPSGNSTNIYR